jgi:hypothetical protein
MRIKLILGFFILLFNHAAVLAGSLNGAWLMQFNLASSQTVVMTASQHYMVVVVYEQNNYIRTYGGAYQIKEINGQSFVELTLEFNDKHPETVGNILNYKYERQGDSFSIENTLKTNWQRIISSEDALAGLWQIRERQNANGEIVKMGAGPRKTIKLCAGGRFQWLAINPATKEFSGTGGGTYSLLNEKYTETIAFFSRDNTRVGDSLSFTANIDPKNWRHTGLSSKGAPVNELWEKVD